MLDEGECLILTLPRADRGSVLVKSIPCHYFQCDGNALLAPIACTGDLITALFSAIRMGSCTSAPAKAARWKLAILAVGFRIAKMNRT